jgi:hypothetical protein
MEDDLAYRITVIAVGFIPVALTAAAAATHLEARYILNSRA